MELYLCTVLLKNTAQHLRNNNAIFVVFAQRYKNKHYQTIEMRKKKRIKLKYGKIAELAKICGVSRRTVDYALAYHTDSDTENLIRQRAEQLGFIKQF